MYFFNSAKKNIAVLWSKKSFWLFFLDFYIQILGIPSIGQRKRFFYRCRCCCPNFRVAVVVALPSNGIGNGNARATRVVFETLY